jgi:hypothetical protein
MDGMPAGIPNDAMAPATVSRYQRAMRSVRLDPARWPQELAAGSIDAVTRALLATSPVSPAPPLPERLALVRQLALDPAYQLK